MSIVPESRLGRIEFYESHLAPWLAHALGVGLSNASVSALGILTAAARDAYNAAEAARQASKSATQAYYDAVRAMHNGPGAGADMIESIRNYAQSQNLPSVYVLAQIPPPATPGVIQPPGTPDNFTVGLLRNGALELKWKCKNPSGTQGTIYEVHRKSASTGGYVFIGARGTRSIVDDTLTSGAAPVTYQITAVRSLTRGNPAEFTVNFGTGGGGGLAITSVTANASPVKIAA